MMIEIRKAGFVNKGAELMLYALMSKLQERYPEAKFCMAPNLKSQPYDKRIELGFYQKIHLWRKGINFGFIGDLLPYFLKKQYGLVSDKDIDVVIDAAGFSYTEQWGKYSCLELASSIKRWKKNKTKVILLPQAFGPYESFFNKYGMKQIVKHADLIFAREKTSYKHLIKIVGENNTIKIAPDFTNLLGGIVPNDFKKEQGKFCIVPNYRMIDKASKEEAQEYIPFLTRLILYLQQHNKKIFFLVHEGENDYRLAQQLSKALGEIEIVRELDPLKIKGILSVCNGVIGSRFHSLVSGLSQGIPSLGIGWSHKYQELFKDYDFIEGLLNYAMNSKEIEERLSLLVEKDSNQVIRQKLLQRSQILKQHSLEMWNEVYAVIEGK